MSRKGTCAFCMCGNLRVPLGCWVKDEDEMTALGGQKLFEKNRLKVNPSQRHDLLKEIRARNATRH